MTQSQNPQGPQGSDQSFSRPGAVDLDRKSVV